VVYAPQFHENYVLGSTFLFNLLLGQTWPPRREDVTSAEAICVELGLGDLLDRMPAGMQQTIGEIGWQLSHGERSRLYLARTLLQGAEITVLDESFASLDPETMKLALQCVWRHASTVIVLAHF
jgi:ABC-type transport system involved in cytochrome bd biosynthesis fused ATPase/permease subunit